MFKRLFSLVVILAVFASVGTIEVEARTTIKDRNISGKISIEDRMSKAKPEDEEIVDVVEDEQEIINLKSKSEKNVASTKASVKDFGATGNGYTDDTNAIQNALNELDEVYFPDGVYMVDSVISLYPKSNQTITLSENAVIKVIPNASVYYRIFHLENVSNVTISGGTLIGDRYEHNGYEGEWGFGVLVSSNTQSITIENIEARDFWGDGFYVGGDTKNLPTNIVIENVVADNNRRQGLSITQGSMITVKDSQFINTNGTAPEAGIDIEPNGNDLVEHVNIINVETRNNKGAGIELFGELGTINNVNISGSKLENNQTGLLLSEASKINVRSTRIMRNEYVGIDIVRDIESATFNFVTVEENGEHGVALITSGQKVGVRDIEFIKTNFTNNSQNNSKGNDGIRIDNYDGSNSIENIKFTACTFADYQMDKTQRYGITVGFTEGIYGVVVEADCEFLGNSDGDHLGVL